MDVIGNTRRRDGFVACSDLGLVPSIIALSLATTFAACTSGPSIPEAEASRRPMPVAPEAGPARGLLTLGTPYLTAPAPLMVDLDLGRTTAALEGGLDSLRLCYEQRLLGNPGLAGRVTIHANITPSGSVDEYCITEDTVGDEDLRACVNALILESPFPEHPGASADVSFPFVFAPQR